MPILLNDEFANALHSIQHQRSGERSPGQHWKGRTSLSSREREVLQLVANGRSIKEIAIELHLALKTVESHKKTIMDKLQLFSVAQLTKFALLENLTLPEP